MAGIVNHVSLWTSRAAHTLDMTNWADARAP